MARRIESLMLEGPVGRLEARLEEPEGAAPLEAALVCHPHPLHGGTMHNKVVHRLARGLRRNGAAVLRFNFRGVNLSEGTYAHGDGEVEDARAALEWLLGHYPRLPYTLAGFSFGAQVILRLGCSRAGAGRLIAAGFPATYYERIPWETCRSPKIFIQSTQDQFGPGDALQTLFARLQPPKQLFWVEAGDHFFSGALEAFEETVYRLGTLPPPEGAQNTGG